MARHRLADVSKRHAATWDSSTEGLKSLRKALCILECFSLRQPRLPLTDIARRVGLPLSVSGPATRIPKDRIPSLAARVREVAGKLSARLGYTGR